MATLLKLGADVTGVEKVERLAKGIAEVGDALEKVDTKSSKSSQQIKTITAAMSGLSKEADSVVASMKAASAVLAGFKTSLDSIWAGGNKQNAFKQFKDDIALTRIELIQAERRLTDFITTSGRYAEIAKKNGVAVYEVSAALRAQEQSINSILAIEGAYVNALSKESLLNNEAVIALKSKTAAINANVAAYERLAAAGKVAIGSYAPDMDYVTHLNQVNASIAAQERGLAALESQMKRVRAARSALSIGSEVSVSNYASSGRESLRLGQYAVSDYAQLGRDRLSAGSKAGGYDYAAQMAAEAKVSTAALSKLGLHFDNTTVKGRVFSKAMEEASTTLHSLSRGASGAAGALWLTYGNMVPMIAGFSAVDGTLKTLNLGAEFDYLARSIQKLGGVKEGAENLELIKNAIYDISKDNVFSSNAMAEGVLEFARAGKTAADAIQNLGEVSKFAYLGEIDLAKAVQLVVGQTSAFRGLSESQAVNTMAVVADKTSISLQQMGEALKNTTSLGAVMGLQFDDVAISIGQLGQSGIRGATAGAALTTMMYKLVEPTVKAQRAMKSLGVEFSAFDKTSGQVKSLQTIGKELSKATESLTKAQRAGLFENLVGLRGIKALGALVDSAKNGADEFKNMRDAINESEKALQNLSGKSYLSSLMAAVEQSGKVQKDILSSAFSDLFTKSYDNSSAVRAMKELREVVTDEDTIKALQTIVALLLKLTEMAAKTITITVDFADSVFAAEDFSGVGASIGSAIASSVAFYFTKNLKTSLAAGALGAAAGGNAYKVSPVPDLAYLESGSDRENKIYAFNIAIKEQEKILKDTTERINELAKANGIAVESIASLDINAKGGGLKVLQNQADTAAARIVELKTRMKEFEVATIDAGSAVSQLAEQQKKANAIFEDSDSATAYTELLKNLDNIRIKVGETNATKLSIVEEEKINAIAEFNAKVDLLRTKFKGTAEELVTFNEQVDEGRRLLNQMYDGQMADALAKDLKTMEQQWDNYANYAIGVNNSIVQSVLDAARITTNQITQIANGMVKQIAAVGYTQEGKVVAEYLAAGIARDFELGLTKVEKIQFSKAKEMQALSAKLFSTEEYADLQADPSNRGDYFKSLGKSQGDFYRGTVLSAAAVGQLNEEQRKSIDLQIDNIQAGVNAMHVSDMRIATEKAASKAAALGRKEEAVANQQASLELEKYTAGLKVHVVATKDANKAAKAWASSADKAINDMQSAFDKFGTYGMSTQEKEILQSKEDYRDLTKAVESFSSIGTTAQVTLNKLQTEYNSLLNETKIVEEQLRNNSKVESREELTSRLQNANRALEENKERQEEVNKVLKEYEAEQWKGDAALKAYYKDLENKTPFGAFKLGLKEVEYTATEMAKDITAATEGAFSRMTDVLVDYVKTGKLEFTDLVDSIISDIARIAIEASITSPLAKSLSGLFSGAGSSILSVFGFHGGGVVGVDQPTFTRPLPISAFDNAPKYHNGFLSNEYPAILQKGESVLTPAQMSAIGSSNSNITVNVIEDKNKAGTTKQSQNNGVNVIDVFVEKIKTSIATDIAAGSGAIPNALSGTYNLNRAVGKY